MSTSVGRRWISVSKATYLVLLLSLCTSGSYQKLTGNSDELESELDGSARFVSSPLRAPPSLVADLSLPPRSAEIASGDDRMRRSATSSVDDVSDERRAVASVTRHHHHQPQQHPQPEPQHHVPSAAQQVAQPTVPKVAWQHRERNKQARIFLIQTQIMNSLRLTSRPNVTSRTHNLSDDEIATLIAKNRRDKGERSTRGGRNDDVKPNHRGRQPHGVRHQSTVVRGRQQRRREDGRPSKSPATTRTFVLLPTCTVPSRLKGPRFFTPSGVGGEGGVGGAMGDKALRMFFNTEVLAISGLLPENNRKRRGGGMVAGDGAGVGHVEGANLYLYWRGQPDRARKNRPSVESGVNKTSDRTSDVRSSESMSDDGKSVASNGSRTPAPAAAAAVESTVRGVRGIRGIKGRRYRRQAIDAGTTVQIAIYQLSSTSVGGARRRISRDDNPDVISTPLKSVTLKSLARSRWIKFNVTSAVDEWIKNPNKNFGLQVVVTGRPGTSVKNNRRRLPGLDGYDCGDHRGERDREVNSTASGSRRRTRTQAGDLDRDTDGDRALSGTSYPKLEVSVVKVSAPDVSPPGGRRRNRGDRRTHRRRNPRDVDDDVSVTSSDACDLQHLDVSLQEFSWSEMTIVQPLNHRFTYCDTPNPCPDNKTLQNWPPSSGLHCCESVEPDPLFVTYRDHVAGANTTFALTNSNVIECRLRYVIDG